MSKTHKILRYAQNERKMHSSPSVLRTAPLAGSKTLKVRVSPLIGGVAKPRGLLTSLS
jgi:hypothetical protein